MRDRCVLAILAVAIGATATACSLAVSTAGLSGGGESPDVGGGAQPDPSSTGTAQPGVDLGDAGPLPVVMGGADAALGVVMSRR